jgi:hypothetical protein
MASLIPYRNGVAAGAIVYVAGATNDGGTALSTNFANLANSLINAQKTLALVSVSGGYSASLDQSSFGTFDVDLSGASGTITFAFAATYSGPPAATSAGVYDGQEVTLRLLTRAGLTITWPLNSRFGTSTYSNPTAAQWDVLTFKWNATANTWQVVRIAQGFPTM